MIQHTFDRRHDFIIRDMKRAKELKVPNNVTVTCINCKCPINKENLDTECKGSKSK